MFRLAWLICRKDLRLVLARSSGLVQALLLGLLLLFIFSLAQEVGQTMSPQGAAAVFWLASAFCQILIFNTLYALEEDNDARTGLMLAPAPIQGVWLGKALAGFVLLFVAQTVFVPATVVFLGQSIAPLWPEALLMLVLVDMGMVALGSLLGALSQGQVGRESLLSIILFPLLVPLLFAGIRVGAGAFAEDLPESVHAWFGVALAFDGLFLGAGLVLFAHLYAGEE